MTRALSLGIVLPILAGLWGAQTTGIVSSNDGSHLALARALALRGETSIGPDRPLTMGVDLAVRDGRPYSDRPPGTAFLALPAVWIGNRLDPLLLDASQSWGELVAPASPYFRRGYRTKYRQAPLLLNLQGTSLVLAHHTVSVGLLGLVAVGSLLRLAGVGLVGRRFAIVSLGLASLWGPYATALFAHGTAMSAMACFMLGIEVLRRDEGADLSSVSPVAVLTGIAGSGAIACDYVLILVVPLATLLLAPRRTWVGLALGAVPMAVAVLAYHQSAFGGPLRIGYHQQVFFGFTHTLATTFDGNPLAGFWTLWGAGHGAGVLVRSPILWLGLIALLIERRKQQPHVPDTHRWLLAFVPWLVVLSIHRTPWGGGSDDYRYLTPLLPLLGLGLGLAWQRWAVSGIGVVGILALALLSVGTTWLPFLSWPGGLLLGSPAIGVALAALVGGSVFAVERWRART